MTIAPSQIDNKVVWLVSDNPDNTVVDGVLTEIANKGSAGNAVEADSSPGRVDVETLAGRPIMWGYDPGDFAGRYTINGTSAASAGVPGISVAAVVRRANALDATEQGYIIRIEKPGLSGVLYEFSHDLKTSVPNSYGTGGRRLSADAFQGFSDDTNHGVEWVVAVAILEYEKGRARLFIGGEKVVDEPFQDAGLSDMTDSGTDWALGHSATSGTAPNDNWAMAEFIVTNDALSDDEAVGISAWLSSEWFGPTTPEEKFNASYADASAADPKVTALIRPADVQRSIDTDVSNLAGGPNLYVVEAIFDIGELQNLNPYNPTTEKPRVFFVKDDQPGLREGKNLLLKGYTIRDADPSVPVTCTFWGP